MKRTLLAILAVGVSASIGFAAGDDSIAARKAAMKAIGKAAKAQDFAAMNTAALAAQKAFKTDTTGNAAMGTEASDAIWSDSAGFDKSMNDLIALSAAGDKAAFGTCKACHKGYRVKR